MKLESIQVYRALAANAVVLSHIRGIEEKYGKGFVLLPEWIGAAGPAGVHLFFVISGCVMVFASRGASPAQFLLSRTTRIYPIYWLYTSLMVVAALLLPAHISSVNLSFSAILKSYALWPDTQAPILSVGWSLIFEMYFYLIWTLLLALALPMVPFLIAWAVFLCVVAASGYEAQWPLMTLATSPLILEFLLGVAIGYIVVQGRARSFAWLLPAGALSVVCAFLFYLQRPANDMSFATAVSLGAAFALLLYAAVSHETEKQKMQAFPSWLVKLGDASYSTYLSHVFLLSVMGRLYAMVPLSGFAAEAVFIAICLIAANVFGLVSYYLIERPTLRFLRPQLPRANREATAQ